MDDWAKALSGFILAEGNTFGEDILFRNKKIKASVGSTTQTEALEAAGYLDQENLTIVLPSITELELDTPPDVNEVLELRNKGYRIDSVQVLEASHGMQLRVQLIPEYQVSQKPSEPIYFTPNIVSELKAEAIPNRPTQVESLAKPLAPNEIDSATDPLAPDEVQAGRTPEKPDQVETSTKPTAPDQVQGLASPSAPDNLEAELPYIDLYLVMGQSNAHGHSPIADLTQEQSHNIHVGFHTSWHHNTSNATTTQYYSGFTSHMYIGETRGDSNETTVDSDSFGIEWGFAKQLEADHTGHDKIGIVKYAVGSSTIDDNATYSDWDPTKNTECFQGFKNAVADATTKIHNAGYNIRWQGFLWYQGESNGGNNPDTYQADLEALITAIENELGVTDLPCVFCAPADGNGNELKVNEAFSNLARTRNDYDFIKITDHHDATYTSVHLSAQNMYDAGIEAGQKMALATSHQAPTSNPFTASDLTTRLWLDMADTSTLIETSGYVTTIGDKSSNGTDLTATATSTITAIPSGLNGRNILSFDNNADATTYKNLSLQSNTRHKWFMVMKATASDKHDGFLTYRSSNPTNELILFNFANAGEFKAQWYINSGTGMTGNTTNLIGTWNLLAVEFDIPNTQSSAWLNGTAYNSNVSQNGSNYPSIGAGQLSINRYGTIGGADWAELIFAENITQNESDKIEGYLAKKWDLVNKLPSTHPYKTYAP